MRLGGNVATYWADETTPDEIVVAMTRGLEDGENNAA
jgi:D-xylose transport system ATP-binding protein